MPYSDHDQNTYKRAASLLNSGDSEGAYTLYRRLFPRHKTNPDFLLQMAIAALDSGQDNQAKKLATRVLKLQPDAGSAHNLLGAIAINRRDLSSAINHFRDFVIHAPDHVDAHLNLAAALNTINLADEALEHLTHAQNLAPKRADIHYLVGTTLRALGREDEATDAFRRTLGLDSAYAGAWKMLAELGQIQPGKDIETIKRICTQPSTIPGDTAKAHFALAAYFEKSKDFDTAFDHYRQGNNLIRKSLDYDIANDESAMADIAETFQSTLLDKLAGSGLDSSRMIFIVGMPRSGTTLVEQILAGHSQVYPAGETPNFHNALATYGEKGGKTFPLSAAHWGREDVHNIGQTYLEAIGVLNNSSPFVTEKLPGNFLYLGAIHAIFPQARIIHCRRDPIDTCLGNYRQLFTSGQYFSYSQDDLVRYYKAYARLMKHWHSVLGDCIMDIQYEQLVDAPEPTARKIVAHCGLDWEDACIDVRKASRPVRTASATQIRNGIHSGYVERWRKFENHIQPLIEGLNAT